MSTCAACLGRIGRIDLDDLSTSFFRFAGQLREKGRPRRVTYRLSKTMIVQHPIDVQVFHTDDSEVVNDATGLLMREVGTFEGDTLMHSCYHLAMLASLRCSLLHLGMLALHLCQHLHFTTKETGLLDFLTCREGSERLESDINADLLGAFWQAFRLTFTRKGDIPLACTTPVYRGGLDASLDGTMIHQFDTADFGEGHTIVMRDTEARLRIGETIVASIAFETGRARIFTCFETAKERFHGKVKTNRDVLKYLRMHGVEGRTLVFSIG
jgi:hypothetical protein